MHKLKNNSYVPFQPYGVPVSLWMPGPNKGRLPGSAVGGSVLGHTGNNA